MPTDAFAALEDLWARAGGDPDALGRATLTGADPILPTDFKIGTAASATIAAGALAASEIWRQRTGRGQTVSVDLRAAVAAFRSERYLRLETDPSLDRRDPVFGFYRAGDGRWIQIHSNLPHHHAGALKVLG
ncbi:MAG TPA: CoA transferase [Candidatus Dormibacteraeota bacterium]|nr:CoA transferase [Candidatus Dormibacteraeota bacterium]